MHVDSLFTCLLHSFFLNVSCLTSHIDPEALNILCDSNSSFFAHTRDAVFEKNLFDAIGTARKTSWFLLHTLFLSRPHTPLISASNKLQRLLPSRLASQCATQALTTASWEDGRDGVQKIRNASSEEHSSLVLEVPTEHPKYSVDETKVHRPRPDHFESCFLGCLGAVHYLGDCSLVHFFNVVVVFFHVQQRFPNRSCSSIPVPLAPSTTSSFESRPAKSAPALLPRVTFFGIREKRLPACTSPNPNCYKKKTISTHNS